MIVFAVILILLSIILFMPVTLYAEYKNKKAEIKIKYGFISINPLKFRNKKNSKQKKKITDGENDIDTSKKDENKENKKSFDDFLNIISAFYEASDAIKKAVKVEKLNINATYGSSDVAFTGMAIGLAYAEIYKLFAAVSCIFTVNAPVITITPDFSEKNILEIDGEGIVKTDAAHIIFAGIKFYTKFHINKKERVDFYGTSHRGTY